MNDNQPAGERARITEQVGAFYERHPYPPPVDDLEAYRGRWDDARRRAESHLFWPGEPYRDDRSILVAGCGTSQAAKYAMRWPSAQVTGIDLSAESIAFTETLKAKYGLDNLQVRQLPVERAAELGQAFDHIVCTGVLHHLPAPDDGLSALRAVMAPGAAAHLMVYAPYGRAGVYLIQDYCRRLGIGLADAEIADLAASLRALPPDHPLAPLLRNSPDFASTAGLADALLHPQDRSYSVPQLFNFLDKGGLRFGRWLRQAPYLRQCGGPARTPHAARLAQMAEPEQYAALELFRGSMARHTVVAHRADELPSTPDFTGDGWLAYVPVRLPDTIAVREKLPPGAAAVLINRSHTYTDIYLPIDADQAQMLAVVDGRRTLAEIAGSQGHRAAAREFFLQLWCYDQVVFDTSRDRPAG